MKITDFHPVADRSIFYVTVEYIIQHNSLKTRLKITLIVGRVCNSPPSRAEAHWLARTEVFLRGTLSSDIARTNKGRG